MPGPECASRQAAVPIAGDRRADPGEWHGAAREGVPIVDMVVGFARAIENDQQPYSMFLTGIVDRIKEERQ